MKFRLAALSVAALALATLTGCTADAAPPTATPTPAPSASSSPTGAASSSPKYTTPAGVVVPDGFVDKSKGLFESDPATTFEGAQMLCLLLNGVNGDLDQMGALMQSEVGLSRDQTRVLLPLAIEFACPVWVDGYNSWIADGGLDRL